MSDLSNLQPSLTNSLAINKSLGKYVEYSISNEICALLCFLCCGYVIIIQWIHM